MIGYAYLDIDNYIVYKTQQYIEEVDPGFFSKNSHFIVRRWKFDTDDISSIRRMIIAFADLELQNSRIMDFFKSINFDLNTLVSK